MTVTTTSRPTGHPGYSETLPRRAESAAIARGLVRTACGAWGLEQLAEDGALIVSELVTNAVLHARQASIRVIVERASHDTVRVAVADRCRSQPVKRDPSEDDQGGRGLLMVAALAADWGTHERRWGKVVWAHLESEK